MEQKAFTLINRGMNRDLSISKVGESAAYENRNIRILAHENDTMLSVTNERGTKFADIELSKDEVILGWNMLKENIVLFSYDTAIDANKKRIAEADAAVAESKTKWEEMVAYCENVKSLFSQYFTIELSRDPYSEIEIGSETLTVSPEGAMALYPFYLEYIENRDEYNQLINRYIPFRERSTVSYRLEVVDNNYNKCVGENVEEPIVVLSRETQTSRVSKIDTRVSTSLNYLYNLIPRLYKYVYDDKVAQRDALNNLDVNPDNIYRVEYDGSFELHHLFHGDLGFSVDYPIESVTYYETDDVQKIYWVDGKNVLRFMNFMAKTRTVTKDGVDYEYYPWQDDDGNPDNTYFDSNRAAKFDVEAKIIKDNSGNPRANGVAQYLLTYFNKHGQETNYVWISDLVYLSPEGRGGEADGQNNNRVTLTFTNLDKRFDHFRVYMVLRTMLDGQTTAYLVSEAETADSVTVVDDGAHLTLEDSNRLLYLGSQPVVAGTLTHKDQTLFLGDLKSIGRGDVYKQIEALTDTLYDHETGLNLGSISFILTSSSDFESCIGNIPYVENEGLYPYENQLSFTSGQITSFKGGEKYRFALKFQLPDGKETDAFWIGDAENTLYPVIDDASNTIHRPIAKCTLPSSIVSQLAELGVKTVQMMIAEATYADRSVKAQGFVNPTVFNVWERYNNRVYGAPSWILRPRNSEIEYRHFMPIHNSISDTAEIECNYWKSGVETPAPYYRYETVEEGGVTRRKYSTDYTDYGYDEYSHYLMICTCILTETVVALELDMQVQVVGARGNDYNINTWDFSQDTVPAGVESRKWDTNGYFNGVASFDPNGWDNAVRDLTSKLNKWLTDNGFTDPNMAFSENGVRHMYYDVLRQQGGIIKLGYFNRFYGDTLYTEAIDAFNAGNCSADRWRVANFEAGYGYLPAYCTKNFMFIDENLVTLNSPEVSYEAVNLDNTKLDFRVIGIAKMSSVISDYVVDASHGDYAGENLFQKNFSKIGPNERLAGLTAWPLWIERGLTKRTPQPEESYSFPEDPRDATPSDYTGYSDSIVYYWLYLWGRISSITGYNKEGESKSILNKKTIGNLHFSYKTIYTTLPSSVAHKFHDITYKMSEKYSRQMRAMSVDGNMRYYTGGPDLSLSCPGSLKYPIRYSKERPDVTEIPTNEDAYLFSTEPIQLSYLTDRHLVFSLGVTFNDRLCEYNVLPSLSATISAATSDKIVPWLNSTDRVNVFDSNTANITPEEFILDSVETEGGATRLTAHSCLTHDRRESTWHMMISQGGVSNVAAYFGKGEVFYGYIKVYADDTMTTAYEYLVDLSKVGVNGEHRYTLNNATVVYHGTYSDSQVEDSERIAVNYVYVESHYTSHGEHWELQNTGQYMLNPVSHKTYDESVEITYRVNQNPINGITGIRDDEQYVVIGEVYKDYSNVSPGEDTRYGGITDSDVRACRFIAAGPQYNIDTFDGDADIYANQGDTYFQRWDCLMTVPNSEKNGVIDITSVMLETHINLDGRTDLQRGLDKVASIDVSTFGALNKVYSQQNNFKIARDLDSDFDTDAYRSSITWTLQKNDMADVDEWTHITLASNLKLDGDKGVVQALRRFRNNIIAFQDRGISEILFNSRTQLSTQDGVPVELANSGKVDGKRYLTNKYGCVNKWSITEGKSGLYFVDNINKAFCSLGEGIENLSMKHGFTAWFKRINSLEPWTPVNPKNFVSFYDRVNSDVYLVARDTTDSSDRPCLVYNEVLGAFTSFFDYNAVTMMTNVEDKFVAIKDNKLWFMHEGLYGEFFGIQYPFCVTYRVTPNPYSDKIWTNIDIRADFTRALRVVGDTIIEEIAEHEFGDFDEGHQKDEIFDKLIVSNEYQTTENFVEKPIKKFRTWRYTIPRALPDGTRNKFGLDRIRNPWIRIHLEKLQEGDERMDLMQLHDVTVKYFE